MEKKFANTTVDELYRRGSCSIGILDEKNYYIGDIVIPREGKHAGEERLDNLSYFGNLALAVKMFCEKRAKRAKNKDLRDFLSNYREAQSEIEEAIGI